MLIIETEKEQGGNSLTTKEKENIHRKINENKTRIGNINKFDGLYENLQSESTANFEQLNESIGTLNSIVNDIQSNFRKDILGEIYHKKFKPVDYSKASFNEDVILLVDSHLGRINPKILNYGSTCTKFFCPTLKHIRRFANEG